MKKPKKPKPATAGERTPGLKIALDFCKFPDGRIVYGPVWCDELARRIDRDRNAAIRRAVRKERYRCALLLAIHQDGNATLEETKAAIEQGVGA